SRADVGSRRRAVEFFRRKEKLEVELARASASFRLALRPPSSEPFRAGLPKGVVLIDLLVHRGIDPDKPLNGQKLRRRLVAWVLRADAPTVRVDLGPVRPIEEAISSWRLAIEQGRDGGDGPARLRRLAWAPLEKHIRGAKVVLISPD